LRVVDIHHLRIFLSVYRNRSFSLAARELRLSQPTVSDHIKTLERHLDCALFERLARAIAPTGEAELLYDHAVEIVEKTEAIRHSLGDFRKDVSGELIVGASSIPGTYLLPPLVASFHARHPAVSFQVLVSDSRAVVEKISRHELLLGVVGSKINAARIEYLPFQEDELVFIAPPSLVKKIGRCSLKELAKQPFVMREEGSGTRRETERILADSGFPPDALKPAAVFGSTDAVKQAVQAGMGVAVVSRFAIAQELRCGTLCALKPGKLRMKRDFFIVHHRKRVLPRLYCLFMEHLRSHTTGA